MSWLLVFGAYRVLETMSLRIGIVGCGHIALTHAQALASVPTFELVGLCDCDIEAARRLAPEISIAFIGDDLKSWLEESRVEAVIVCTPPSTHLEIVQTCLQRGVHVLCEKPLAISAAEAQLMRRDAMKYQRLLLPAFKFRFCDAIQRARKEVQSNSLGDLQSFEIAFCAPVEMRNRWNSNPKLAGGGVLMDNGPHAFDLARFLFGEVQSVEAQLCFHQKLEVEDACKIQLETRSGLSGQIKLDWTRAHSDEWFLTINGTKSILQIGWTQSRRCGFETNNWQNFGDGYQKMPAFVAQLQYFASQLSADESTPQCVTIDDGVAVVVAVQDAYQAAREKRRIESK